MLQYLKATYLVNDWTWNQTQVWLFIRLKPIRLYEYLITLRNIQNLLLYYHIKKNLQMNGKKMEMCYQSENSYFWAEGLLIIFCCCFTGRFYLFSKFYEHVLFMKLKKQGFFPSPLYVCLKMLIAAWVIILFGTT